MTGDRAPDLSPEEAEIVRRFDMFPDAGREDRFTTTERDAALWEARRAVDDWVDERPSLAECDRDEAEMGGPS